MGNGETREEATAESRWGTMATGLRQGFYKHDVIITAFRCDRTGDRSLLCLRTHIHAQHLLAGSTQPQVGCRGGR